MPTAIVDGTGEGNRVKVNEANRLLASTVSTSIISDASAEEGRAFVFASGDFIAITTTATETGIFHLKNTSSTRNLYIDSIRTCGEAIQKWKLYKNSTGGTLITAETAADANNLKVSSRNTAEATVYKGADGSTLSGGTMMEHWINPIGHSTERFSGSLILGKNDSIQLTLETDSAQDICCRVIGYYLEAEEL